MVRSPASPGLVTRRHGFGWSGAATLVAIGGCEASARGAARRCRPGAQIGVIPGCGAASLGAVRHPARWRRRQRNLEPESAHSEAYFSVTFCPVSAPGRKQHVTYPCVGGERPWRDTVKVSCNSFTGVMVGVETLARDRRTGLARILNDYGNPGKSRRQTTQSHSATMNEPSPAVVGFLTWLRHVEA